VPLRIIEDETSILSDEDAAKADKHLAEAAPGMTFGEVRSAAHKLVAVPATMLMRRSGTGPAANWPT
jgi:hypothetical protein